MATKTIRRTHKDLMEFLGLKIPTPVASIEIVFDNIGKEWLIIIDMEDENEQANSPV